MRTGYKWIVLETSTERQKGALKETQEHNMSYLPGRKTSSRKGKHIIVMVKGTTLEWLSADYNIRIRLNNFFSQNCKRTVSFTRIMCLPSVFLCSSLLSHCRKELWFFFFLEASTCQSNTWDFPWAISLEVCTSVKKSDVHSLVILLGLQKATKCFLIACVPKWLIFITYSTGCCELGIHAGK